jgi:UDP-N-acetylglucosamine 2-epimerase (non-hydrolysing)/GDP/UDP-N,N'-diacetylbacillosamine 2-epimerase (hydrolysing)
MRTIGVVTVARSDYGIYLPILRMIQRQADLALHLIVSGMHLSPEFGQTITNIKQDGFVIGDQFEMLLSSDSPEGVAKSTGLGVIGFAQSYARLRPDLLLVLGDRTEMLAAAVAALPFNIPLAHIHGGEVTEGAIDEVIRHSITKMSHLHFASTEQYGARLIQMGEERWRVHISGAPGLDNIRTLELYSSSELAEIIGHSFSRAPLLVTFHPVTREVGDTVYHIAELMAALGRVDHPIVFTYPNADTSGRSIIQAIEQFVGEHANATVVANLGTRTYFSLLNCAAAMIGNSSSGIIEAPSFRLPVVNIGNRQQGRVQGRNVINADYDRASILSAIDEATSRSFKATLVDMTNPYGDGTAAERIVDLLRTIPLDNRLLKKRFVDLP